MKLTAKTIFVLDGLGAVASAITAGLILPVFAESLGLPIEILYGLSALAVAFSCFSFFCYFCVVKFRSPCLVAVIAGNICYCLLTLALILFHPTILALGRVALGLEILVVLGVVLIELRVLNQANAP
jgi:hypothetical protein